MPGGSAAPGAYAGNSAQPAYARRGRHGAVRPQQGWASPSETCDMGFAGSAGAYVSPIKRFAGLVICVLIAVLIEVFGFRAGLLHVHDLPAGGDVPGQRRVGRYRRRADARLLGELLRDHGP